METDRIASMLNYLRGLKHRWLRNREARMLKLAEKKIIEHTNGQVMSGVFAGTQLLNEHVFGSEIPKLLGCYELELQTALSRLLTARPRVICNIGAAEGYYAIGCSRYAEVQKVIVYEALELGQELVKRNAELNRLSEKIVVRGTCDENELAELLASEKVDLVLIDIEGAELDILSQRNVDALNQTSMLIESHDFCRPNCLAQLKEKFGLTHALEVIESKPRTLEDFPDKIIISDPLKLETMNEMRPGIMSWLCCVPLDGKRVKTNETPNVVS